MTPRFELDDLADRLLRQRLRRERYSDEEIEARVTAWYHDRPGAPHGDADGEPGTWPRSSADD